MQKPQKPNTPNISRDKTAPSHQQQPSNKNLGGGFDKNRQQTTGTGGAGKPSNLGSGGGNQPWGQNKDKNR